MQVLLCLLEFPTWLQSRGCSYSAQLALEEGLAACGASVTTLTSPWFPYAREICAGRRFDQVWVEIARHEEMNCDFLDWIAEIAPTRVGFAVESLTYTEPEYQARPQLRGTIQRFESRLPYVTHAVTCDEGDADHVTRTSGKPALWWPQAVPKRFVSTGPTFAEGGTAIFSGGVYGLRKTWLGSGVLSDLLRAMPSPEAGTTLPEDFDRLHKLGMHYFQSRKLKSFRRGLPIAAAHWYYNRTLRRIRVDCFQAWLRQLQCGLAVVNLPHLVKTYAGRVVEAMAAGVPVISWEIPDRPRNRELFEDGREILSFPPDGFELVAEHILSLQRSPARARALAEAARRKILAFHTMEERVRQILRWIEHAEEPKYS